jgi:hypothetical protein
VESRGLNKIGLSDDRITTLFEDVKLPDQSFLTTFGDKIFSEHVIFLSNVPSLFRITSFCLELLSVNNILPLGQITHPLLLYNILDLVSTITTFGSVAIETGSQTAVLKTEKSKYAQIMSVVEPQTLHSINDIKLTLYSNINIPKEISNRSRG